jgi:DNA-3-methyladenine glycosylase
MQRLERKFFARPTLLVARDLIGKYIIYGEKVALITETEAYLGEDDPASHAYGGQTPRNTPMFGLAGHAYVYFVYGMHHCLNITTEKEGIPGAVLIREALPVSGFPHGTRLDGPARLTKAFGITKEKNTLDICNPSIELYLADNPEKPKRISANYRIGISDGSDRLWRFTLQD